MTDQKVCPACGSTFKRNRHYSQKQWDRVRGCSISCGKILRHKDDWKSPIERFKAKIEIGDNSECWNWTGTLNHSGYGEFILDSRGEKQKRRKGNIVKAHRFSYETHIGRIPNGMMLRHTCHNRACVNPMHLLPGNAKQNYEDSRAISRHKHGHTGPRLSEQAVIEIVTSKSAAKILAAEHNITEQTVHRIRSGRAWSNLTGITPRSAGG